LPALMTAPPGTARAAETFLAHVYESPEGQKIKTCLQCGTCSGSCPVGTAMDYSPRAVFAALRAEQIDRVLNSNTMWLCASCYACTVRCPAGIQITDVMYDLKRLAFEHNLVEGGRKNIALARSFTEVVDRLGRSAEVEFLARYILRTTAREVPPGKIMLKSGPLGLALFLKGRLLPFGEGVRDRTGYRATMAQGAREDAKAREAR
jgi:heterodisulfide reductase subunit C